MLVDTYHSDNFKVQYSNNKKYVSRNHFTSTEKERNEIHREHKEKEKIQRDIDRIKYDKSYNEHKTSLLKRKNGILTAEDEADLIKSAWCDVHGAD